MKEIYDIQFVENLFDRMSGSYSKMNYITSFGFNENNNSSNFKEHHQSATQHTPPAIRYSCSLHRPSQ